jgi:hypothetical protein
MGKTMMDVSRWDAACRETEQAHAAILKSLHRLEDALLVSKTPDAWKAHVHLELVGLLELLEQHRRTAAPPTGLLGLIDLHGHSRGVTDLVASHERLLDDAQSLLQALSSEAHIQARYSPFRRDAARLGAEVRAHEAQESALIYETDVRVSGGEG